eukprot:GILK01012920.1.p1 GENE.GILK01012920.1~~GILK01012920.1.p1  ORF type:complete len:397 (-),score=56.13 GILK01012920.1:146-1336(-)
MECLPIYLDFNATTPIDPQVANEMLPCIQHHFGNPSSSHVYGVAAKRAVDTGRKRVANMLGCSPDEIIFLSGGTESINFGLKGVALKQREMGVGDHIVTSAIEHPAVLETCKHLEAQGFRVTYVPVDRFGVIDLVQLEQSLTPQTILVSIMHANNEVGTIQDLSAISRLVRHRSPHASLDASQSVGKVATDVDTLQVDMLTIAGHKLYAPKGIGVLYVRKDSVQPQKLIHGASHEQGRRAGTENVIFMAGLGKACELFTGESALDQISSHLQTTRDHLETCLRKRLAEAGHNVDEMMRVNGYRDRCLPNTLSVSFKNIIANKLLHDIQDKVAASAGAACHSDTVHLSHVLEAMKVDPTWGMGTLRLSTGKYTTNEEVERAAEIIVDAVIQQTVTRS